MTQIIQKNAKEAFRQGTVVRTHWECLGSEVYDVYRYYLPNHIRKKIRWLKSYFSALDNQSIPIVSKRRKHWCEFAETAMLILARFDMLLGKNYSFLAGSKHVSALPWATFGPAHKKRLANNFCNIKDVFKFYANYLHGPCHAVDLHFRTCPGLTPKLANKFSTSPLNSPNLWMAVAIVFAVDLIKNCGPDCSEVFELFTNDYRDNTENIDLQKWQELRCLILGIKRPPAPETLFRPQVVGPIRPVVRQITKAKAEIKEIAHTDDLEEGETTKPVFLPKYLPVPSSNRADDVVGFDQMANSPWPEDIGIGVHGIKRGPHRYRCGMGGSPDMM